MSKTLTRASAALCPHGAPVVLNGTGKLTINGVPVVTEADRASWSIAPGTCSHIKSNAHPDWSPCLNVISISGNATKLTVNGSPVMLEGVTWQTDALPTSDDTPLQQCAANQTLLTAM